MHKREEGRGKPMRRRAPEAWSEQKRRSPGVNGARGRSSRFDVAARVLSFTIRFTLRHPEYLNLHNERTNERWLLGASRMLRDSSFRNLSLVVSALLYSALLSISERDRDKTGLRAWGVCNCEGSRKLPQRGCVGFHYLVSGSIGTWVQWFSVIIIIIIIFIWRWWNLVSWNYGK